MQRRSAQKKPSPLSPALRARLRRVVGELPARVLLINAKKQTLTLFVNNRTAETLPAATSRFGIGNRTGSFMTPPGVHRIRDKIGLGAPAGRIFRDRADTGHNWLGGERGDNLILTRILRLEGCEKGINRGPGIDSYKRYIYIHGTNKESSVGRTPISHGCVCLKNNDIISLFEQVEVGDIVVID